MTLDGVHLATGVATCLSLGSIILCIIVVPSIVNEVSSAWYEFDVEMQDFRIQSNDLWQQMVSMSLSISPSAARITRQSYGSQEPPPKTDGTCKCKKDNKCPPGPPGPPGPAGEPGYDGLAGNDGLPGSDAASTQRELQKYEKCFHCPHGPMGPPGALGKSGPRGMRGAPGPPGMPGRDSPPGTPGEMGAPGLPGANGPAGPAGEVGNDAEAVKGLKGAKGVRGPTGPPGPNGDNGKSVNAGLPGPPGPPGDAGFQGAAGPAGEEGEAGDIGEPGKDANYCPCPGRSVTTVGKSEPTKASSTDESYSGVSSLPPNDTADRHLKPGDQNEYGKISSAEGNLRNTDNGDTGAGGQYLSVASPQTPPVLPPKDRFIPAEYPAVTYEPQPAPGSYELPDVSNPTGRSPHPPSASPPPKLTLSAEIITVGDGYDAQETEAPGYEASSSSASYNRGDGVTESGSQYGSVTVPASPQPSPSYAPNPLPPSPASVPYPSPLPSPAPIEYPAPAQALAYVQTPSIAPTSASYPQPSPPPASYPQPSPPPASYPQPSPAPASYLQPSPASVSYPQPSPPPASYPQPSPAPTYNSGGSYFRRRAHY